MKTKYPIRYERHPTPPIAGQSPFWDGEKWVMAFGVAYAALTLVTVGEETTAAWDCQTGLNKTLSVGINFTLNIQNAADGFKGSLIINVVGSETPNMTVQSNIAAEHGSGTPTGLANGVYHFTWICDDTRLLWKIELHDV